MKESLLARYDFEIHANICKISFKKTDKSFSSSITEYCQTPSCSFSAFENISAPSTVYLNGTVYWGAVVTVQCNGKYVTFTCKTYGQFIPLPSIACGTPETGKISLVFLN